MLFSMIIRILVRREEMGTRRGIFWLVSRKYDDGGTHDRVQHVDEGGAGGAGVNPDETTFEYLKGRPHSPQGAAWDQAVEAWKGVVSDPDCSYDDVVNIDAEDIELTVTWGITPGQSISINGYILKFDGETQSDREAITEALST